MKLHSPRWVAACLALLAFNTSATVLYVDASCANPTPPYAGWSTAATNIQDAVDAATDGDFVLVTNGVYQTGGRVVYGSLTNRVVINKLITMQSVNGPAVTVIQGCQDPNSINGDVAVRCAYLTNGASFSGFTLTNGATLNDQFESLDDRLYSGGGIYCESLTAIISNCIITSCSASDTGGGAVGGTLNNCVLTNSSSFIGGGAGDNTLNNCVLASNSAFYGGGIYNSLANNCLFAGNSGNTGGGAYYSTLTNCLLTANSAPYSGGADTCTLNNCTLTGNSASYAGAVGSSTVNNCALAGNSASFNGGGAYSCFLTNCVLSGNSGYYGGGAELSTLQSCVLSSNTAALNGGGADSSTLNQCTLFGNSGSFGGGASGSTLNSCTLSNNFAVLFDYEGGEGGGADYCNLANCLLTGNSADYIGGGADSSAFVNCTLADNSAGGSGGGASQSLLNNCIVYFNTAPDGPNFAPPTEYYPGCTLNYCCTTPMPDNGADNFTNAPLVVDPTGGDFHLQSNSPCINAGNNSFVPATNDLDGNPRIQGGTVDVGAYEYQTPTSIISYAWLQHYGLPTDGSADFIDSDGDGMNNWQEWIAGTDPTNPLSLLKMTTVTNDASGMTVTWQSVSGITYFLQRSTDLGAQPAFSTIQTGIAGQPGTTSYTDTDATGSGPYFYRVGVQQ
jgi:hypothetical protein